MHATPNIQVRTNKAANERYQLILRRQVFGAILMAKVEWIWTGLLLWFSFHLFAKQTWIHDFQEIVSGCKWHSFPVHTQQNIPQDFWASRYLRTYGRQCASWVSYWIHEQYVIVTISLDLYNCNFFLSWQHFSKEYHMPSISCSVKITEWRNSLLFYRWRISTTTS